MLPERHRWALLYIALLQRHVVAYFGFNATLSQYLLPMTGDAAAPAGFCPGCVAVYYKGLAGSSCYRIPTIIKTHTDTLLAFAENRKANCNDHDDAHDLVVRRSQDHGRTWGPVITIYSGKEEPCPGCPASTSNPNPVEVRLPDGSWAVLLHFDTRNSATIHQHGLDMQIWSHDDGLTWSNATVLSYPPVQNVGGLVGPSVGIQSSRGTIFFSNRRVHQQTGAPMHFLYWSEDYGKTWSSSPEWHEAPVGDESSIAFLTSPEDETIIMSLRTGAGARAQLIWDKDRKPGAVDLKPHLKDSGCQGSIVNQDGILYVSHPKDAKTRAHMTVQQSGNQGRTWTAGKEVWAGPSAYSQLVPLGGGKLGLLFEGGEHFRYDMIAYAVVDMADESWNNDKEDEEEEGEGSEPASSTILFA
mmetsp:Transcript_21331/g.39010  ORF Transcript_21331/g.39010 Transcript_21331/m.39010 type:complete len:414 (+) Transcript_21331:61-1302(+)